MKIAHWKEDKKRFVIDDVKIPELKKGEALIKVVSCAVSGTDLYRYKQDKNPTVIPFKNDETPGHEIAGIIEKIRGSINNLKEGDRVVVQPFWGCAKCLFCRSGKENFCVTINAIGFNSPGGMSEYIKAKSSFCFKIPEKVSFDEAVFTHHIAVVYYSLKISGIKITPQTTAAIFGTGNLGLLMVQVLKYLKIKKFFMVDINKNRLTLAKKLSGGKIINLLSDGEPLKLILENTKNEGVDFSVELAGGNAPTLEPALKVLKKGGIFVGVGVRTPSDTINLREIMRRDLRIQGSTAHTRKEMTESLQMIKRGSINTKKLITHSYPLERINEAFETRLSNPDAIAVIVNP